MNLPLRWLQACVLVLPLTLVACGDDDDLDDIADRVDESVLPQDLCALPPENDDADVDGVGVTSFEQGAGMRTLDHDGGTSDLNLDWTEDEVNLSLCPGTHTLNLAIQNNSGHTVGDTVWYTILYYHGQEYVAGHAIDPRGMDVAVGETVPVQFTIDLRPEFASAERNIRVALIVQTDNPNPNDPVAYFRRVWVNISPTGGCGVDPMPQPAAEPLTIHSVTCPGNAVRLQTNPRLVDGTPSARVVEGGQYMSLTRDAYLEDDLWWADLNVTQNIPNGEQAVVAFGSNPGDTMYFRFSARAECGGNGVVNMGEAPPPVSPPPADDGTDDDGADDDGNGDDGDPGNGGAGDDGAGDEEPGNGDAGNGTDGDDGDDIAGGGTGGTGAPLTEAPWFDLDVCAVVLEGTIVPVAFGNAQGELRVTEIDEGSTELVLQATGLPADPTLPDGDEGIYRPWLAKQTGEGEWLFVALPVFESEGSDQEVNHVMSQNPQGVNNVGLNAGYIVREGDGELTFGGIVEGLDEAEPLDTFTHFFVTVEPRNEEREEREYPNNIFVLSGQADYPE